MRKTMLLLMMILLAGATALEAQVWPRGSLSSRLSPGWLGISFRSTIEGRAGTGGRTTVMVVAPESPADRAGVRAGDVIVRWNGRADVADALREAEIEPGDTVRLRVRREGERDRDLTVVAAARPDHMARVYGFSPEDVVVFRGTPMRALRIDADSLRIHLDSLALHADSLHRRLRIMLRDSLGPRLRELEGFWPRVRVDAWEMDERVRDALEGRGFAFSFGFGMQAVAGAEFSELNPSLGSYFGTDEGALVLRVAPETPAARAGLAAGDVVVEADDREVETVADLRRAVAGAEGRALELEVIRKGERRTLQLRWDL